MAAEIGLKFLEGILGGMGCLKKTYVPILIFFAAYTGLSVLTHSGTNSLDVSQYPTPTPQPDCVRIPLGADTIQIGNLIKPLGPDHTLINDIDVVAFDSKGKPILNIRAPDVAESLEKIQFSGSPLVCENK